ncbi:MAG: sialate O-acetylesterase [Planctomycetia bacterium]|nr:sialate O-acetylesterase [Planctomycetia bacterium]
MNTRRSLCRFAIFSVCALVAIRPATGVQPHALFSNGAVLQQGMKVPVWGMAADGEKVTVQFQNQELSTTAKDGRWRVDLAPLKPGGPFDMTIAGGNTVKLTGILVGEVWIASGQSNMQWSVKASADPEKTIAESANPQIHLITIPRRATPEPQATVEASWQECGPATVGDFSAVAYFFGRDLQQQLKVPVGMISTNYGGTPAEAWTSHEGLAAEPSLAAIAATPATDKPNSPGGLYNAMIHPLLPYAIRGAIWYQGESNAGKAYEYRTLFPAMIKDWRAHWRQGDFPFLLVQLAPYLKIQEEPMDSNWAELREAQLLATQTLPHVGMAVITDVGEEADIHPKKKAPVGARLALAARAIAHGEKVEHSGPEFYQQQIDGKRIVLSFKHTSGGLVAKDGPLKGFTIAGEDQKFVNAKAEIQGDKIVVDSPEVEKPVAVRFGWANYPVVNLWNGAGLPASPFRTDSFPLTTQPK